MRNSGAAATLEGRSGVRDAPNAPQTSADRERHGPGRSVARGVARPRRRRKGSAAPWRPIYRAATTGGGSTGSAVRATSYRLITSPWGSTKL